MLFSYTLLFAMLTTFVVAAPTSPRSHRGLTKDDEVLELPAEGIPFREAAKYLAVPKFSCWTRLPSPKLANVQPRPVTMVVFFKMDNDGHLLYHHQSISLPIDMETNLREPIRELIGYWYQTKTNRMMKITLEEGEYRISPLLDRDVGNEIPIAFKGEVKLTDPMAAYYVAAAGGTWTKSSDVDGNDHKPKPAKPVKGLSFDFQLQEDRHLLNVRQHYEDGSSGGIMPVGLLWGNAIGNGLIGVWRFEPKVPSVKRTTITIECKSGTFYMEVEPPHAASAA